MTPERWRQIESLYHDARLRPAVDRAAFLAGQADDDLRREVERLLSQPGSDEGFLAQPVATITAGLSVVPATMTGRSLGGYDLQALIGVGGMGEVYRARDGKLGRQVAIKVLPQAFTSDAARLARFEREARMLAALNHPNICAIHGFEQADQVRFLILELVDGETLAHRLTTARRRSENGGLPQREALTIARQIARALDFAHERGIVHRDLKPANIKITTGDAVKVLDFGLAKAAAGDASGGDLDAAPLATIDGAIVGTPAYMSPEQARGKPVDKRTDIWAFGCVLYEMLAGRATFAGDTVADTIASVIEREPDWTALPAGTPEPIRNLLIGCLAKDSRDRLRDIGDVRITIDSVLSGSSGAPTAASPRRRGRSLAPWLPWTVAAVLGLVLVLTWNRDTAPSLTPPSRWPFPLPDDQVLDGSGGAHVLTLSRDGSQLAYVATPRLLYIRPMTSNNESDPKPVPGTEKYKGVRDVEFSPDGKQIAFYALVDRTLKRLPVVGGQDMIICPADTPTGIFWGPGDMVLFGQGRNGIWRASLNTSTPQQIAEVNVGEEAHGPQLLPDGDHFLFTIATGRARDRWDRAEIVVQSLTNKNDRKKIGLHGSDARYVKETGHLLYAVGGSVYAIKFDPNRREVEGTGVIVQEGVRRAFGSFTGAANYTVADDGTFAYVPGPLDATQPLMTIAVIDPSGKTGPRKLEVQADRYDALRASRNGTRIAVAIEDDKAVATIYTLNLNGPTSKQQLTTVGNDSRYPAWTYDGERIAFQSSRGGSKAIWWQALTGSDDAVPLTTPAEGESHIPESFAEDGTLLFSSTKDGVASLWTLPKYSGKLEAPTRFGRSTSNDAMSAVLSPDGKLVAYTRTDRSGTTICVEPFPVPSAISCLPPNRADSPKHPRWSADGQRIFYDPRAPDFESVTVQRQPVLQLVDREPVPYHPFRLAPPGERTPYDVAASGKFIGLIPLGQDEYKAVLPKTIMVVLHWFEVLKDKTKK